MMNPEIIIVPMVFGTFGTVVLMFRWFKHREHMASLQRPAEHGSGLEDRMERIERAVEAIAVEVERVGEGQRFVTKLLAESNRNAEPKR
jgi:hypothetical protein